MLMPSILENLFDDDWMNFPFNDEFWGKRRIHFEVNMHRI